jgi:hypothetical protein
MIYVYKNQAKKKAPRVNALKPGFSDAMRQTVGQILRLGLASACDCRERERARAGEKRGREQASERKAEVCFSPRDPKKNSIFFQVFYVQVSTASSGHI